MIYEFGFQIYESFITVLTEKKGIGKAMGVAHLKQELSGFEFMNIGIQHQIMNKYNQNQAKDIYSLKYIIRAEKFTTSEGTKQIEVFWSNKNY